MDEPGLLDALLHLFDLVWASSNEVVPSASGVSFLDADRVDAVDARILTLLLAGLTDQAIGASSACRSVRSSGGCRD